ncbi:MAG: hypothetical protein ACOZNI_04910 [Myxococcota bacterium]
MAAATIFLTLPLGILLGSWLGARFGARAILRLLFPIPTIVYHLGVVMQRGVEAASTQAAASLATVPMVFAWAIPFAWLSRRVGSPFVAFVPATAVSFGVQRVAEPALAALGPAAATTVAVVVTALAVPLLRSPGPVAPAPLPAANLAGRLLSIVGILMALAILGKREGAVAAAGVAVLAAFPRMTMELSVGTWLAAGPEAARQALSGLPLGLWAALAWCCGLAWLPRVLPAPVAIGLSFVAAVAVTAGLARTLPRD